MQRSTARLATGVITGALAFVVAAPASVASATPAPDPITISSDQVRVLCEERVPRLLDWAGRLTERIEGDAGTLGSVAWLQARAEQAAANGRTARAEMLNERAERRASRVDELADLTRRMHAFQDAHCAYLDGLGGDS